MSEQFGHYVLEGMIGRGGMGEVYRAYDTRRDRIVALKRLPRELVHDETFQARFRRECRLVARLNEPHVIPIHDFGEIDGHLYLDMRLVEGTDLSTVISDGGPMDPKLAVDVIGQIAAALQSAHTSGLVHRDVKPSNILLTGLTEDRQSVFAYLVDFGIARSDTGGGGTALTATTGTVGTLGYMAPERISGGDGDSRSDIYSLACVFYECLTGHSPFKGETFQVMYAHVNVPPPVPSVERSGLPPALDNVVRRGLAKDPAQRYQTATELAAAARAALADSGVTPPGPPGAPGAPNQSSPAAFASRPPLTPPPPRVAPTSGPVPGPTSRPPSRPTSGPQPPPLPPTQQRPISGPMPPPGPPPGSRPVAATSGPIGPPPGVRPPTGPTFPPPPRKSGITSDKRNLVAIGIAVAAVIVATIIVVAVTTGGGGSPSADPTNSIVPTVSTSGLSGLSSIGDFPTPTDQTSSGSSLSTSGVSTSGDFSEYADFTDLIGDSPGDTGDAFKNATCSLADPDASIAGMVDQVICKDLTGSDVEFYVGRFSDSASVDAYVNTLVDSKSYTKRYWTTENQRRGLLYTSPTTADFADVTSSICSMPTYLVQFYASGSSGISETTVFDDYWKAAPFPNTTPPVCSS